jgi:uncharacterized protein
VKTAEPVIYLDSSAIVKLVIPEPESPVLLHYVNRQRSLASSALARVEVRRSILDRNSTTRASAESVMDGIDLISISARVLERAATFRPKSLRTLDAIHLATAQLLGNQLARLITYDARMADAARGLGWAVDSPA